MHRKGLSLIVLLVVTLLAVTPVLAAHTAPGTSTQPQQEEGVVVIAPGESIQIGLAASLSGDVIPEAGQDIRNAAQLAVDQFNEEMGGIEGFPVELLVEDDQCIPEQAGNVANLFVTEPRLVAVVGHMCSGATAVAAEIYEEARIPMVSASATNGQLTAAGFTVFNRTVSNDDVQGLVVGRYIAAVLEAETLAVLHDNSDYGRGLAETVAAIAAEEGVNVLEPQAIDPAEQDYRAVLTVIAGEAPDVLYFGGYQNEAALIVDQMREVGMEDTIFFSADGVLIQQFLDLAGDAAEGSHLSLPAAEVDEEVNETFDAAYEEAFGLAPDELGPFHAQSADAAAVIIQALMEVATLDDAGNLVIDREELITAIRATEGYEGVSGTITCNEIGECSAARVQVFIVEDGEFVQLEVPEELQMVGDSME
ncbi:MAG: branched-chain amino acid ABC transporter substrate-binding protein [Anaerolineae bacterium]|nr:branched-chain amino acid ABC transporter substrate-binding protein [Anaerolineae bacterium]